MSIEDTEHCEKLQAEFFEKRKYFLKVINEQLEHCYYQNISALSERMVKEHGPGICIDFDPFEPLELYEIPVSPKGFEDLKRRVGHCNKAFELLNNFEREVIMYEYELKLMAVNFEDGSSKQRP